MAIGEGSEDKGRFSIVGNTLTAIAPFNYEARNSYNIRVRTTGQGGLSYEEAFTINVTNVNEQPTNVDLSNDILPENQPTDTVVGALSTADVDSGDNFTYTLVSGGTDNPSFYISDNQLKTAESFDFEARGSYNVRIRSTDDGGLGIEKSFTIHVTNLNEEPNNIALPSRRISENQPPGTVVGTFNTSDPDSGDTFTYDLTIGEGSGDNGSFSIVGNTLRTDASFNYEAQSRYSIRVRTTDQIGLSYEKAFTIDVTNINEQPSSVALLSRTVPENQPTGIIVGELIATDPDANDSHTYALISGEGDDDNASFIVDDRVLKAAESFDYETKNTYSILIRATDSGGLLADEIVTINVGNVNEPPFVADPIVDVLVPEDSNDVVLDLSSVFGDLDVGDSLALSVTGNTVPELVTAHFSGTELTLSFLPDANGSSSITIRATDAGLAWIEDTFAVTVNPVNDTPTVVNPIADVAVDENGPDTVVDLSGVFNDVEDGANIALLVFDNTNPGLVTADLVGDQLTLSYAPNQFGTSDITIRATDSGESGLWAEDAFTVTVVSDNLPPTVANPVSDVIIDEDAPDTVLDISDVFEDVSGDGPILDYSVVEIDPLTGEPAVGTGLFGYTFTLYGQDGADDSFVTQSLTFSGDIRHTQAFGSFDVSDELTATTMEGISGSGYIAALDTWMCDGWQTIAPGDTDITGAPVVLSLFTGAVPYKQKDLVYIVAGGDVQWSGTFMRQGVAYGTSGIASGNRLTLSVQDNTNPGLITAAILGTELTLSCIPDASGEADITIRATDEEDAWTDHTFTVTVDPVNDAPTVDVPIADVTVDENASDFVIDLAGVFSDIEDGADLTLSFQGNTNPGLVAADLVDDQLTLSYAPDQFGTADVTIRATDSGEPGLWIENTFTVTVISNNPAPTVANGIADITVAAGGPDTILYLSDVFDDSVDTEPVLDYTVVEIDPVTGAQSAGTGLFAYTFTLYGNDGVDSVFATTSLTFTGDIRQAQAFGSVDVNDEDMALLFNSNPSANYVMSLDSWLHSGWTAIAPGNTSVNGTTLVVSVGSGTSQYYSQKDLVRIVASGDVSWFGMFSRQGVDYPTIGTADANRLVYSITGNTAPGLVTPSLIGGQLTLAYAAGQAGTADITIRATDPEGGWVDDTFTVAVEASAEVVGRSLFYNNSAWDGISDDDAIATDKTALLAGQTATSDNYTNYSGGINGLMIDIDSMAGTPTPSDFGVQVNSADDPNSWAIGPAPAVSVRPGEGIGGSDRVTLVWPDGAIVNQWVEITALATPNTGLASADVFYFGNATGESNGDGVVDELDYAAMIDEFGQRGGIGTLGSDFDADGRVGLRDFAILRSRFGNTVQMPTIPAAAPEVPTAALVTAQAAPAPIAAAPAPVIPVSVRQTLDGGEPNGLYEADVVSGLDSNSIAAMAPTRIVDLLAESLSASNHIPEHQPISSRKLQLAATAEYDLRPLGDDPALDVDVDSVLADMLAESALALPL